MNQRKTWKTIIKLTSRKSKKTARILNKNIKCKNSNDQAELAEMLS